jgi:hypothetical protein
MSHLPFCRSVTAKIGLYVESDLSMYFKEIFKQKSVRPCRSCRKYIDRSDSKGDPILAATDPTYYQLRCPILPYRPFFGILMEDLSQLKSNL